MRKYFSAGKAVFLFWVVMFVCIGGNGQETRLLSLEEAVALAGAQSKQGVVDSLSILIGQSRAAQARQLQLPEVQANASFLRISDNIVPFKVAFPTGEVVLNPQILNQSYNSVQLRQPVWSGGRIRNSIKSAELDRQALDLESVKSKRDLAYQVTSLWYQLYALQQSKRIIEANILLLTAQRRDAQRAVKEGILLENELLKVDLAVTSLESNLVELETYQKTLSYNVCMLTGLSPDLKITVVEELPALTKSINTNTDAVDAAIKNRPELRQFDVRVQQAELGRKVAKANYLPNVSVGGMYNYDRPNQRLFPNQAVFTGTWSAGAFLQWSLSSVYTTKQKVLEADLAKARTAAAKDLAAEGIQMEVNANFNLYQQALQKITIGEKALLQAKENFRVEQNRFRANTISSTDYLNANTLLLQSELNLTASRASADLAYQRLLKSIN